MEDGLLSLKWNNHKSTFFHILSSLRKKETYTDATLACEGKFFPVHKFVMSTCSDYFCEVFENTNCKSPVVILKDIKHRDLEALLDYMYLGEVDVKQNELAGLIKAAECLRIKGLAVPDEDPALSPKKTHIPENRLSPSAKRARRESASEISHTPFSSQNHHCFSPPRSHSSIVSTSVPSQSVNAESFSQVPSRSVPTYINTRHSNASLNDNQKHINQSDIVPIEMIKVEVDEENSTSQLQLSKDKTGSHSGSKEESSGEGSITCNIEEGNRDKESISNNFGEYSTEIQPPTDIEKEEHDQIDPFSDSDQVAGPSGVQGHASQIVNWGGEGSFPHNLFGNEDSSHQQVTNQNSNRPSRDEYEARLHSSCADELKFLKSIEFVAINNGVTFDYCSNKCNGCDQSKFDKTVPKDDGFEGFEMCYDKLSEIKRNLIYNNLNVKHEENNEKFSSLLVRENDDKALLNKCVSGYPVPKFHEIKSFELIAQEFEEELERLPYIGWLQECNDTKKSKFYCYNCNQTFKSQKDLSLHLSNPNSCSFLCPVCPYNGQDLAEHIHFHSESRSDGSFTCLLCEKAISPGEEFLRHLKEDHTY